MKLSVIICTYNRRKYIPGLFESLKKQTLEKPEFEIVFIDNNSTDEVYEICADFETLNQDINFSYHLETNQGLSYARNRGIQEAKGEILVFIDDDALAFENYLENIIKFFDNYPEAYAAGGRIYPKYESSRPKWMSKFLEPIMSVIDLGNKVKEFPSNKFPIGANMAFRKEVFEKTENFNVNLGRTGKKMLAGEEKDLFNRIRKNKGKIYYIPDAEVYHIISDERLTMSYIKKQAVGVGESEKIRAKTHGKLFKSYFIESFKWVASWILFFFYLITFQLQKAVMIIKFRHWVSSGLF